MALLRALPAVVAALVSVACVLPLPGGRATLEADRRELEAASRMGQQDPALGRARLRAFLAERPGSRLADDAGLELARLERRSGRDGEAERALRTTLSRYPRGDRSDAVRLELADLLRARGDLDAAWVEARRVRPVMLPQPERRRADLLLLDLARERGDRSGEIESLARLRAQADPAQAARLEAELVRALDTVPTSELLRVAEHLEGSDATTVWLAAAERAFVARDRATALRALAELEGAPLDADQAARRARLETSLTGRGASPVAADGPPPRLAEVSAGAPWPEPPAQGTIGVVLPLSGPFAGIAEQALRGVLLATGVFGEGSSDEGTGMRVLVRDSGGDGARAAVAVRELAANEEVAAVVGPLLPEEVQPASDAAQETGIPLLALTRHDLVVAPGAAVLRLGLTRRMEAEVLADHAVRDLGFGRFAILYPLDDYGRDFEVLLWEALEARGGRVVAVAGYDPQGSDFAEPIRSLVGWSLLSDAERRRVAARDSAASMPEAGAPAPAATHVEETGEASEGGPLPPIVDFDALFVPDAPDKVALIVPQLGLQGIDVRLFGSSAWHHADLVRGVGPRLEGAFFTSAFDPANPAGLVPEFVRRYAQAFGGEPSAFAAQGFDAATLVALQLAHGVAGRAEVGRALLGTSLYPGVSGTLAIGSDGNARRRPFLVGVQDGQFVSLE
jgi:ABC-type branched-subunit amino acid transport system substrate-binding protein